MRRILVDHARASHREKRGGGTIVLALDEHLDTPGNKGLPLIALDDALNDLEKLDAQQSRVVELRFFAGLSIEVTAEVLHVSKATVNRDWVTHGLGSSAKSAADRSGKNSAREEIQRKSPPA